MRDWHSFLVSDAVKGILEQEQRIRDLMDPPFSRYVRELQEQVRFLDTIHSDLQRPLDDAALALSRMAESQSSLDHVHQLTESLNRDWSLRAAEIRSLVEGDRALQIALRSHTARMAELSLAAETLFSKTDWNRLGRDLLLPPTVQASLLEASEQLVDRYGDFITSLSPSVLVGLPYIATALPALEVFLAGDLAHSLGPSPAEETESPVEIQHAREAVRGEAVTPLDALLSDLDRELLVPLTGARLALRSSNPDRPRHVAASLRELFTHVLHRIAPDDAVRSWTKSPEHFHKGRPTRRARLLYVVSVVNHGPMAEFLESDVEAVLKFLDVFQGGTHETRSLLTDDQLAAMIVRMEGLLRFLLEMWRLRAKDDIPAASFAGPIQDPGDSFPGIESRPEVCGGEPCVVRTRIPVWLLIQARRLGTSEADLLRAYPTLRAEDLANAWAYYRAHPDEIERQIRENEAS